MELMLIDMGTFMKFPMTIFSKKIRIIKSYILTAIKT